MNWKSFKKEILSSGIDFNDESKFVLGLDIGNSTSTISYWNFNLNEPQLIDISGGYGNPSMPTVVQYVPGNKEWIFGEYALLNKGDFENITFTDLVNKLGSKEILDVDGKGISIPQLLGKYIKALIESCANINPNAEVAAIVMAVPTYIDEIAKEELQRAIAIAGFDKEFIGFVTDRECAIKYYYYQEYDIKPEKIIILDYGSREIRGGVYDIVPEDDRLSITALSSIVDEELGTQNVDNKVKDLFTKYYCKETEKELKDINESIMSQLENFSYQNRQILFQNSDKNIKVYFNFAFPAFQKNISPNEILNFILPLEEKLEKFLYSVCNKVISRPIKPSQISKVICLGGGFEMKWAKEAVEKMFSSSKIITMKGSKGITAQGACISSAIEIGILNIKRYDIQDFNIVNYDIGVKAIIDKKEQFIPLIEKGSFWWQQHSEKIFILDWITGRNPHIEIYSKNDMGEEKALSIVELADLPERPKRTTRLKISIDFKKYDVVHINIKDYGFGELFKASNFEKNIEIKI